ncbi:MAG: MFS transporter [Bacteroidetes bacterium]|nr:MFS transporter [Bacteroidota bacterium]
MSARKSAITRTVWILSIVSLFTDVASEMLYPIMPVYLQKIGFSVALIGLLEGFAEATAGLSKGYFGRWSDSSGKRLPFVQLGYLLSGISKPLLAVSIIPIWVFLCRTMDRFGKGIRTGARDALLSAEATQENKGAIFGLHRSFDTLGAAIGPTIALIYLYVHPEAYIHLFLISLIPGLLAVLGTRLIAKKETPSTNHKPPSWQHIISYWKDGSSQYRKIVLGFLLFALINSSDVFLLLRCKDVGFSDTYMIGMFILYNLVYALTSYPLGKVADQFGLKRVFILGLAVFSFVYLASAFVETTVQFGVIFAVYGVYSAATYGISKAWISKLVPNSETGAAMGTYAGLQSVCAMLASTWAGFVWYQWGAQAMFIATSLLALGVVGYFLFNRTNT